MISIVFFHQQIRKGQMIELKLNKLKSNIDESIILKIRFDLKRVGLVCLKPENEIFQLCVFCKKSVNQVGE